MTMKYALVTGASRGIGRACALKLAKMGYNILINYLANENAAMELLSEVKCCGVEGELLRFDVADKEQVGDVLEKWMEQNPDKPIDVLVNNAGIRKDNLMFWMSDVDWSSVVSTSLDGTFYVTRPIVKMMMSRKFGRIINIVSLSGQKGMAGQTNYSAAKAGVIGLTKALSLECARKRVTVNAVAPGFIQTDMTGELNEAELSKTVPMGRFGRADEVADLVGFLASDAAGYITGEVIAINGGLGS